jgi:hypothetical protein
MITYIMVRFQFEGWHRWPEAARKEHSFLIYPHRHMFHVQAKKEVTHENRDIEFIELKGDMEEWCRTTWGWQPDGMEQCLTHSCESMARVLCDLFNLHSCQVMEDGENGAEVISSKAYMGVDWAGTTTKRTSCDIPNKANVCKKEEPVDEEEEWGDDDTGTSNYLHTPKKKAPIKLNQTRRFPKQMFWGIEAEGPHRGVKTLFVPGDVDNNEIFRYVRSLRLLSSWELRNIYFGADNCRKLQLDLSSWIKRHGHLLKEKFSYVWAEVDQKTTSSIYQNEEVLVVEFVDDLTKSSKAHFVKTVDDLSITWKENTIDTPMCFVSPANDPLFDQDYAV